MSGREMIVLIAAIAAISLTIVTSRTNQGVSIEPPLDFQRRNAQEVIPAETQPEKAGSRFQLFEFSR
jgi:hypothetical protein